MIPRGCTVARRLHYQRETLDERGSMISHKHKCLIALLGFHPKTVITVEVSRACGLNMDDTQAALLEMLDDVDPYGPLVHLDRDGWRIAGYIDSDGAAGGYAFLQECQQNPQMVNSQKKFVDEVLTGITESGKRSKIINAALPSGSTHTRVRNPETTAHNVNASFAKPKNRKGKK